MLSQGHRAVVIAAEVDGGSGAPDVFEWTRHAESAWSRRIERALWRIGLQDLSKDVRQRRLGRSLLDALDRAGSSFSLIEMEETQGLVREVVGRAGCPVVVRLHGPTCILSQVAANRPSMVERSIRVEREGILMAHGVSAPSRSVKVRMEEYLGADAPPIEVIPNPVAIPPEHAVWTRRGAEPERLVYVGRLARSKGVDVLLAAFRELHDSHPGATLTLVGPDRGIVEERGRVLTFAQSIERLIPEPSIRSRVEWIGPRAAHELDPVRRRGAVLVMPSRFENFPFAVAEAAALGCPIVASDVGGIPEMLEHGRSGRLFPVGDASALAVELRFMLDHPDHAESCGREARLDCAARLDPAIIAAQMADFYRRVIARGGSRASRRAA